MDIVVEILRAIGRLFINPLLYIAILMLVFFGYVRVKRERKYFKIRILGGWTELKLSIGAIVMSIVLSIVFIIIGIVLPVQFLVVLAAVTSLCLILQLTVLLSPVLLFSLSLVLFVVLEKTGTTFSVWQFNFKGYAFDHPIVVAITISAGLLLLAEAQFVRNWATYLASPILEKTKRGGQAVAYLSKGAWILPIFVLVPGDVIAELPPYFPIFGLGDTHFNLVVFPFIVGFRQMVRKTLPVYFYPQYSKSLLLLGQIVIIGGVAGYFEPIIAPIVLLFGAVMRIVVTIVASREQHKDLYAVVAQSTGTMIAAVLPDSPAEKMGLLPGEIIKRVNGRDVFNERELYEALQINAALCKLEVLDHQNEIRLTQHVVHSNDHHRIGVLLAESY